MYPSTYIVGTYTHTYIPHKSILPSMQASAVPLPPSSAEAEEWDWPPEEDGSGKKKAMVYHVDTCLFGGSPEWGLEWCDVEPLILWEWKWHHSLWREEWSQVPGSWGIWGFCVFYTLLFTPSEVEVEVAWNAFSAAMICQPTSKFTSLCISLINSLIYTLFFTTDREALRERTPEYAEDYWYLGCVSWPPIYFFYVVWQSVWSCMCSHNKEEKIQMAEEERQRQREAEDCGSIVQVFGIFRWPEKFRRLAKP